MLQRQTLGQLTGRKAAGLADAATRGHPGPILALKPGLLHALASGGPGYSVPDENLPATEGVNYPAGTVAMANAGPGTAGSQFFIVYDDTTLPPAYTVWGTVTEGLDMVKEIASVGVADGSGDGAPRQPVFIESATVGS